MFFLLHLHGLEIKPRVRSVLEIESGINDPMAVFLTVGCVELLLAGDRRGVLGSWRSTSPTRSSAAPRSAWSRASLLVWLINRLELAAGLYPVLAMAFALFTFGGAQVARRQRRSRRLPRRAWWSATGATGRRS